MTDIEDLLNENAQTELMGVEKKLLSVEPPPWLRMTKQPTPEIAVKPDFNI